MARATVWLRRVAIALGVALVLLVGTVLVAQRMSDGPMGPISGGPLRAGELVTDSDVDWAPLLEQASTIELQLVEPPTSRVTGAFVHDGSLYVPCDLGFLWRRVPSTRFRSILRVIWSVKHWHEDALRDGRVVLRVAGKRYQRQAVRVTDPALLATLRGVLEQGAKEFFAAQGGLLDGPGDPNAIWFFRIDPRPGV